MKLHWICTALSLSGFSDVHRWFSVREQHRTRVQNLTSTNCLRGKVKTLSRRRMCAYVRACVLIRRSQNEPMFAPTNGRCTGQLSAKLSVTLSCHPSQVTGRRAKSGRAPRSSLLLQTTGLSSRLSRVASLLRDTANKKNVNKPH